MYVVTVARKPLSEPTVAANVLEHGCGALSIEASRVGLSEGGRWPANLVLQHRAECRRIGTKQVAKGGGNGDRSRWLPEHRREFLTACSSGNDTSHYGPDGKETVAIWECEPGCPVSDLDRQSLAGGMHSAGGARQARIEGGGGSLFFGTQGDRDMPRYGDGGGASRFFKQLG